MYCLKENCNEYLQATYTGMFIVAFEVGVRMYSKVWKKSCANRAVRDMSFQGCDCTPYGSLEYVARQEPRKPPHCWMDYSF
jgi:hypothetical protein